MGDVFGIGSFLGAVGGSLINGLFMKDTEDRNRTMQRDINRQNIQAQKEINQSQLDYAREMTQAQWERDDDAHQREVADLAAAGLSPLANTSGSQVTSAQSYTPQSEAVAESYKAQAPQLDVNAVVNSIQGAYDLFERKREHEDKMIREDKSLDLESEKLAQNMMQLDIKNKEVQAEYQRLADAMQMHIDNINQTKLALDQAKDLKEREFLENKLADNQRELNKAIQENEKLGIKIQPFFTFEETDRALQKWTEQFNIFLGTLKKKSSSNFGIHIGASHKGTGGSIGIEGGSSINEDYYMQALRQFTSRHPMPQYVPQR